MHLWMTTELLLTRPWRWKGLWRLTKIRHCGREDRNRWCPTDTQRLWRRWRLSCSIQRVETWHRRQKTGGCATFVLPPPKQTRGLPTHGHAEPPCWHQSSHQPADALGHRRHRAQHGVRNSRKNGQDVALQQRGKRPKGPKGKSTAHQFP